MQKDRQTEGQTDRRTDRQKDGQTDRRSDRQKDRSSGHAWRMTWSWSPTIEGVINHIHTYALTYI